MEAEVEGTADGTLKEAETPLEARDVEARGVGEGDNPAPFPPDDREEAIGGEGLARTDPAAAALSNRDRRRELSSLPPPLLTLPALALLFPAMLAIASFAIAIGGTCILNF